MIEDHRPLVEDLTSAGHELIDLYTHENGQTVRNEVAVVTSKYDDVKRATREKLRQLIDVLRRTVNDVSSHTRSCLIIQSQFKLLN